MDPHLKCLHDEIHSITTALTSAELAWHPPEKWSAAEILEHLYLTYTGTIRGLSRILESEVARKRANLKQRAGAFLVLELGYFPEGVQAPASTRPKGSSEKAIVADITSKIVEMDAMISICEAKFGSRAKIYDHPFLGPFSTVQWRKFHLRHGRHHLKQIQRLQKSMRR